MSMTPSNLPIIPKIKRETLLTLLSRNTRIDGRKLHDFRPISIELNYIPKAEGSALVKLGNTIVLAGIKCEIGTPFPDTPNEGVLTVHAEFVPLASPTFEPGPPDENAIELARVIDRSLRELKVIDLSKLAIIPGKKVWIVWVDIYILNHDGNLIDASMLASMAALLVTKKPKAVVEGEEVKIIREEREEPLPITNRVVSVSVGKIGEFMIIDPTAEEEQVLDVKLVISVSKDGKISGMQLTGMGSLSIDEVHKAVELALNKATELHKILEEATPSSK